MSNVPVSVNSLAYIKPVIILWVVKFLAGQLLLQKLSLRRPCAGKLLIKVHS